MANFTPKIEYIERATGTPKSVNFSTPPEGDPFKENYKHSSVVSRSNNGTIQTQFNHNTLIFDIEFAFETQVVKDEFTDFVLNHASRGGSFNYFIHNDEVEFETYKFTVKATKFKRPVPDGAGDFLYGFKFKIERQV